MRPKDPRSPRAPCSLGVRRGLRPEPAPASPVRGGRTERGSRTRGSPGAPGGCGGVARARVGPRESRNRVYGGGGGWISPFVRRKPQIVGSRRVQPKVHQPCSGSLLLGPAERGAVPFVPVCSPTLPSLMADEALAVPRGGREAKPSPVGGSQGGATALPPEPVERGGELGGGRGWGAGGGGGGGGGGTRGCWRWSWRWRWRWWSR